MNSSEHPGDQQSEPACPQQRQDHPGTGRAVALAEPAPAYGYPASADARFITAEILNATGGTPLP